MNLSIKLNRLEKEIIIAKKELNDIINRISEETNINNFTESIFIDSNSILTYKSLSEDELPTKFLLHDKIDIFFEKRDILNSLILEYNEFKNNFDILEKQIKNDEQLAKDEIIEKVIQKIDNSQCYICLDIGIPTIIKSSFLSCQDNSICNLRICLNCLCKYTNLDVVISLRKLITCPLCRRQANFIPKSSYEMCSIDYYKMKNMDNIIQIRKDIFYEKYNINIGLFDCNICIFRTDSLAELLEHYNKFCYFDRIYSIDLI